MKIEDKIRAMLINDEGKKLKVYPDTKGILTVGIGHNIESNPAIDILKRQLRLGDKITEIECNQLFQQDFNNIFKYTKKINGFDKLQEKYQIVILSMLFQLGLTGTLAFTNTLQAMRLDNADRVVGGIKASKWYKQTTNRCDRLIKIVNDEFVDEYGF